jgi:ribonuclease P protein component
MVEEMFLKEEDKKVEKLLLFSSLKEKEINQVFQSKNSFKNGVFIVKHINESDIKFLVTFSKKLKLSKPKRNKIKRQILHILREEVRDLELKNFHIVLILIKLPQENFFLELKKNIKSILIQIKNV